MTVEAIRVCGAIAALISDAALPTASRLEAQEAVEKVIQPILAGDRAVDYEALSERVDDLADVLENLAGEVGEALDAVKRVAKQIEKLSRGNAA